MSGVSLLKASFIHLSEGDAAYYGRHISDGGKKSRNNAFGYYFCAIQ